MRSEMKFCVKFCAIFSLKRWRSERVNRPHYKRHNADAPYFYCLLEYTHFGNSTQNYTQNPPESNLSKMPYQVTILDKLLRYNHFCGILALIPSDLDTVDRSAFGSRPSKPGQSACS